MKDDVLLLNDSPDERRIADIAANEMELAPYLDRQVIEPAVAVKRVIESQSGYFSAGTYKSFGQV
jgi:hypothetical protein